jgi:hypothetical protein
MRIVTSGKNRAVILIGPYAVKIAKLNLSYSLRRTVDILRSGQTREKIVEWKRDRNLSLLGVVCESLFCGVMSNMREYYCSRNHSDFELMPTLWTFLYLVNVQRRGIVATERTKLGHPLFRLLPRTERIRLDIDRPEQYCWHGGRLLLVDYAHPDINLLLAQQSKPVALPQP